MRIIRELPHRECRITLFSWNNRYLIKLEQGLLEQTFKVDQLEFQQEEDVIRMIDGDFIQQALLRFREMAESVHAARERLGS
jgi:hypothetical protein